VRHLVEQIALGLQAFHRKEMLHQDLRPENLIIDRTGTVKIIDFASTHVAGLTEGTLAARPQAIVGSLQYTAPEYFVGGVGSPQSELFALAVITYQMLTGHLPYGLQVTQLRSPGDLQRLRYIPARERRPDLPFWLDAVLRRALHPQVNKRQEALSEFVHDLRTPRPQYQRDRTPPLIERHPVVFWQVLTVLLAAAVLVLLGLRLSGR
jgi:serine/threonine protein kinase